MLGPRVTAALGANDTSSATVLEARRSTCSIWSSACWLRTRWLQNPRPESPSSRAAASSSSARSDRPRPAPPRRMPTAQRDGEPPASTRWTRVAAAPGRSLRDARGSTPRATARTQRSIRSPLASQVLDGERRGLERAVPVAAEPLVLRQRHQVLAPSGAEPCERAVRTASRLRSASATKPGPVCSIAMNSWISSSRPFSCRTAGGAARAARGRRRCAPEAGRSARGAPSVVVWSVDEIVEADIAMA